MNPSIQEADISSVYYDGWWYFIHASSLPWWRHQMETFSMLLAHCVGNSPVTGEFPSQRPVTRSCDVFCHLCLNKRLSKQSRGWWFETPSCSLWRHCNGIRYLLNTLYGHRVVQSHLYTQWLHLIWPVHYDDVIMTTMASQVTSLTVVYSTVYSNADQRKHQTTASLAFVWGIHRDRWIPRTKGQLRGKCFHLMTSSWTTSVCQRENSIFGEWDILSDKYLTITSQLHCPCHTQNAN